MICCTTGVDSGISPLIKEELLYKGAPYKDPLNLLRTHQNRIQSGPGVAHGRPGDAPEGPGPPSLPPTVWPQTAYH